MYLDHLHPARTQGLVTEARISEAAMRLYLAYMRAGRFDPVDDANPFRAFGAESLNSSASQRVNLEAGEQALVLLQNTGGLLPLNLVASVRVPRRCPRSWCTVDCHGSCCMLHAAVTLRCVISVPRPTARSSL